MKRVGHFRIIQNNGIFIVYGRNCDPIDKFSSREDAEDFVKERIVLIKVGLARLFLEYGIDFIEVFMNRS